MAQGLRYLSVRFAMTRRDERRRGIAPDHHSTPEDTDMDERHSSTADRTWSSTQPGERSMTDQAREVVQSAREGFEQASGYVNDTMQKTQQAVNRYRDGGVDQMKQDVVDYTRQQPMTALMIATGAGLLLGMLMAVGRK